MQVQLTNAGAALLAANTGPITLTAGEFGSGVNYIPEPTDTALHGSLVFTTAPTAPSAVSGNVVRYSVYVDYDTPTFSFGEFGLFTEDGTLFALAVSNTLITKTQNLAQTGNALRMDIYLSMVATNYEMWLDLAESNNGFQMAVLGSVDQLPQPQNAVPNAYVISGASAYQSAFLAYTNRQGLWNFDAYDYADQATATISAFDNQSVTIPLTEYVDEMTPAFLGQVILEYTTGALYGLCRYVSSAIISGNNVTLGFDNPVQILPVVGDQFVVYARRALSVDTTIPPATTSILGGVIVGTGLTVSGTGLLAVNYNAIPYPVTSVNGLTGAVVLNASNITGFAAVAYSGSYNDLTNKPAAYSLPVASTTVLGGVKAPSSGTITIAGDGTLGLGFSPVSSVNGNTGAVVINQANPSGFATVAFTGNYADLTNGYVLPAATASVLGGVIPGTGLSVNGSGVLSVTSTYTLPPATTSVLGGVIVGSGISVTNGTISVTPYTLPPATTSVLGGIIVGTGLSVTGGGVLSATGSTYTLPPATTSTLGGVIVGSGISVSGGTISVTPYTLPAATTSVLGGVIVGAGLSVTGGVISVTGGGVTSVSGQTGAVVVEATDANTATGTSLIVSSGSTSGNITLKRIVAGTGVTLTTDGSGNMVIASSGSVTSFNSRTGAVVPASGDYTYAQVTGAAPLASPSLTGTPLAPTATAGTNNTQIATTAFVAASKYYDIPIGFPGSPTASQLMGQYSVVRGVNLLANFSGSVGFAGTAPTAAVSIAVYANGTILLGNILFAAGSQTATFTTAGGGAQVLSSGEYLTFVAPASPDATLANVSATLYGVAI